MTNFLVDQSWRWPEVQLGTPLIYKALRSGPCKGLTPHRRYMALAPVKVYPACSNGWIADATVAIVDDAGRLRLHVPLWWFNVELD